MRAKTQFRRHQIHHDSAVKGVARDCDTRSAHDGVSAGLSSTWTKLGQREVTCATTEVADQNQLVVIELSFILVCGGYWFQFECDFGKAGQIGCCSEPVDSQSFVLFGISSSKADGPADYDAGSWHIELFNDRRP